MSVATASGRILLTSKLSELHLSTRCATSHVYWLCSPSTRVRGTRHPQARPEDEYSEARCFCENGVGLFFPQLHCRRIVYLSVLLGNESSSSYDSAHVLIEKRNRKLNRNC